MHLTTFSLTHFKNYTQQTVACSPHLTCFVGQNGAGKTNLLEAIYYLCMGKSYFNLPDLYLPQHGESFFRLEGEFRAQERTERVVIKVRPRRRKEIERNGVVYERLSDYVGRFPVVIIVPDDTKLVQEGSETRRRLLDNTLSQLDPVYLRHLITYNRVLKQRNALLKEANGHTISESLLGVYDQQLAEPAAYIHQQRQRTVAELTAQLQQAYAAISAERETVACTYRSQLYDGDFITLLAQRREKDRILQRTTVGIHRDDLVFSMDDHPLGRVASQGQLKSFVLAIKLAQYQVLRIDRQVSPVLLLDDIFDKLDQHRVGQLLAYILADDYGQVFISDTDSERVARLATNFTTQVRRYRVVDGTADELE